MSVKNIREKFPILNQKNRGKKLIYFDSAATSLKPISVIETEMQFYKEYGASIHRSVYELGEKATNAFENTRKKVAKFIGTSSPESIVFTKSATESINLVADAWGFKNLKKDDVILLTDMEHHSNIVPWQMIADENKLNLKVINVSENGEIDMDHFNSLISEKTKLVSIVYISNTLGTINPVKKIIEKCKENNILSVVDGAQSSAHKKIDVTDLNCDFYVFSAHKMYGPTGVGVVYGKEEILEKMPPYMGGGEMIKDVSFSNTSYNNLPYKFEAGTPNIGDVIGFKEAINYIKNIGIDNIETYEISLKKYTEDALKKIDGIKVVGTAKDKVGIFSFTTEKVHYYDLGLLLDAKGIALRTGHHCTQPLMDKYSLDGTARLSLAIYNSTEEVDYFVESLSNLIKR